MKFKIFLPFVIAFLIYLPGGAWADDLITNGNLETDSKNAGSPDGWAKAKTGGSYEVENGNHFLRLRAAEPDQMNLFYREIRVPTDAKALELKFRARVTELKVGSSPWFDARIMLNFTDDARKVVKPGPKPPLFNRSTEEWVEKSVKFLVPEGATMLQIMPALFKVDTGTLDFDDVSLTPIDPAAVAATGTAAPAKGNQPTPVQAAK